MVLNLEDVVSPIITRTYHVGPSSLIFPTNLGTSLSNFCIQKWDKILYQDTLIIILLDLDSDILAKCHSLKEIIDGP